MQIAPGLACWTAPHPDWSPQPTAGGTYDWDQMVGSVIYELTDIVALVDPQLPAREDRPAFLEWLDERIAGRPVTVLTTIRWHRRDRRELAERYRSSRTGAWNLVPAGIERRPLRGAGETLFWLPGVATLVAGDRIIGKREGERQSEEERGGVDDARLCLCPESWLDGVRVDRAGLAGLMRPLLELPIERVLVSHGEPVLHNGRAELAKALEEAHSG